jgi:hypothetical protein
MVGFSLTRRPIDERGFLFQQVRRTPAHDFAESRVGISLPTFNIEGGDSQDDRILDGLPKGPLLPGGGN